VRALHPRACALGYNLPPLTGLRKGRPHEEGFVNELMRHDTRFPFPIMVDNGVASLVHTHSGRNNPLAERVLGATVRASRYRNLRRALRAEGSRLEDVKGLAAAAALPEPSHQWRGFARWTGKPFMARQLGKTMEGLRLPPPTPATCKDK